MNTDELRSEIAQQRQGTARTGLELVKVKQHPTPFQPALYDPYGEYSQYGDLYDVYSESTNPFGWSPGRVIHCVGEGGKIEYREVDSDGRLGAVCD